MDSALNNLLWLICHENQTSNQPIKPSNNIEISAKKDWLQQPEREKSTEISQEQVVTNNQKIKKTKIEWKTTVRIFKEIN